MNIFGAFTFGSLIKTFLPGLVWLLAILILEIDVARMLNAEPPLWNFVKAKDQAALVLAIPASILIGLISNIVVFMGINDWLVRIPVRRSNPDLCALYDALAQRIRERCWTSLKDAAPRLKGAFDTNIDPEVVALHTIGVEKLAYLREQYWYHLEFQLNLLLSLAAMAVALVLLIVTSAASAELRAALVLTCIVVTALIMAALLKAARKNYCRHVAKMASMMAAVLCPADSETSPR